MVFNLKLEQDGRGIMIIFLFGIIWINTYPISRAAGAMYQSARGNAIVRVSNI